MQMGSRHSSSGSQAGPRQGPLGNEGGAARGKGHRRTASSGQGTATAGESGPEWTEEVDQVHHHLLLPRASVPPTKPGSFL